jgi:hypothetical protein
MARVNDREIVLAQLDTKIANLSAAMVTLSTEINEAVTLRAELLKQVGEPSPVHDEVPRPKTHKPKPAAKPHKKENVHSLDDVRHLDDIRQYQMEVMSSNTATDIMLTGADEDEELAIRKRIEERRRQATETNDMVADLQKELQGYLSSGMDEREAHEKIRARQREIMNAKYPVPAAQLRAESQVRQQGLIEAADDLAASKRMEDLAAQMKKIDQLKKNLLDLAEPEIAPIPDPVHR